MVTSDRRNEKRPQSPSRRSIRRPAIWFNVIVLFLGLTILGVAQQHRRQLDARFLGIVEKQLASPYQIAKIRSDLASMEITRNALDRKLEEQLAMAASFEAAEFYLAIDTSKRKLRLHFGPEIVRETDVVIGEPRTVTAGQKSWQFVPLKGGLTVIAKLADQPWEVPAWAWALRNAPVPAVPVRVPRGLGRYVILLPNGYVIHTQPSPESPLAGVKPGSFMIAEEAMQAIWPRISGATRVYIY